MVDDTESISKRTWIRNIEPVNKIGYMDGASDGQTAVYQSSFDKGYKQGFSFGLELGFMNSTKSLQQPAHNVNDQNNLRDPRRINCQICLEGIPSEQNTVNLFNTQHEKNNAFLNKNQCT